MKSNIESDYLKLLKDILDNGVNKDDRTGTGTRSVFGRQIRHNMQNGFPLLTTKRMPIKTIVTELKWFLKGDTNIKYLVDNNCNIWNGDAYKKYQLMIFNAVDIDMLSQPEFIEKIKTDDEFAKKWGDLGPIYGKQWRRWVEEDTYADGVSYMMYNGIDQIKNLIEQLKTNPDSRRLMVNAWNVGELDQMVLPPCHYGFQMYTKQLSFNERWSLYSDKPYNGNGLGMINTLDFMDDEGIPSRAISLMWNQRSVDTFLGLPFNIASYGLLLELIAKEVNMVPDELIGNLGDVHLYTNHIDQAKEQLYRQPMSLPKLHVANVDTLNGEFEFDVLGYKHHETIKAPLSN
jgi:thymidylate synthase|tara:strand:+ start:477 stop:1514 length:1038 start_codon:yes stop_codon:yes gene_type:complete